MRKQLGTGYVSTAAAATSAPVSRTLRGAATVLFALVALMLALGSTVASTATMKAEAFDPVKFVACFFGEDSMPANIYQLTQSSDMQFAFLSKSHAGSGEDDVAGGLNWALELSGMDFQKVNEDIIGTKLTELGSDREEEESEETPTDEEGEESFNKGSQVNPYDRFGFAGLEFSNYSGEWKYMMVDACGDGEPTDPKANAYYEDRLEPRSVWEDIDNSPDPRTDRFTTNVWVVYWGAFVTLLANLIFWGTKFIVAATLSFVNFSFTDITKTMGINKLLGAEDGLFTVLFNGVYFPLLVVVFGLVAIRLIFIGIVRARVGESLRSLLGSLLVFFVGIVVSVNPMFFVELPNKVAVVGQSIVVTAMNSSLAGGTGLCETDIGSSDVNLTDSEVEEGKEVDFLTEAATNMRSSIGCQFWQTFAFDPWSEGQWGTDWNHLWANDKTPEWAPDGSEELGNENGDWVGEADVPMGNDTVLNNWALFQISTQTNAHSPLNHSGELSKYTSGVANDWWRIVDATSNYQEEEFTDTVTTGSGSSTGGPGAWGGHENGKIPEDELAEIPWASGQFLREDAAEKLKAMNDEFRSEFGKDISITDAYRDYDTQVRLKKEKPNLAAKPGTSNHGWGLALDLGGGINNWNTPERDWMVENASKYGWVSPDWAQPGNGKEEPWHWEFGSDGGTSGGGTTTSEVSYDKPKNGMQVTDEWDTWSGANPANRLWTASSSLLIASIGMLGPLVFGLMACVYAIGVGLVMAFAPVAFLMGAWGGRGMNMFVEWGKLLLKMTIARIVAGLLLVMAVVFTNAAIQLMDDVSWWRGIFMMVLLTVVLIKGRHRIIDAISASGIAASSFDATAQRMSSGFKRTGQTAGRLATSPVVAGARSKMRGGTFREGAKAGAGSAMRTASYQFDFMRHGLMTYDQMSSGSHAKSFEESVCAACGQSLEGTIIYKDPSGNVFCRDCGENGFAGDDVYEVLQIDKDIRQAAPERKRKKFYHELSGPKPESRLTRIKGEGGKKGVKPENAVYRVGDLMDPVVKEINSRREGSMHSLDLADVPPQIRDKISTSALEEALREEHYDWVMDAYTVAWTTYVQEQFEEGVEGLLDDALLYVDSEDHHTMIGKNDRHREEREARKADKEAEEELQDARDRARFSD